MLFSIFSFVCVVVAYYVGRVRATHWLLSKPEEFYRKAEDTKDVVGEKAWKDTMLNVAAVFLQAAGPSLFVPRKGLSIAQINFVRELDSKPKTLEEKTAYLDRLCDLMEEATSDPVTQKILDEYVANGTTVVAACGMFHNDDLEKCGLPALYSGVCNSTNGFGCKPCRCSSCRPVASGLPKVGS